MNRNEDNQKDLISRLQRLEATEAIRSLKARYLNACDTKRSEEVRSCFIDGPAIIDVGHLGIFQDAESFVAMYERAACSEQVHDKHQGGNAEIRIIDDHTASARWCLDFRSIDTGKKTLTLMSTFYHDTYARTSSGWKISGSRTEFRTLFTCSFTDGDMIALIAGRSFAEAEFTRLRAADAPAFAGSAALQRR